MIHRTYRLRDTLEHMGACEDYTALCRRFDSIDDLKKWLVRNWHSRIPDDEGYTVRWSVLWALSRLWTNLIRGGRRLPKPRSLREKDAAPAQVFLDFQDLWKQYADLYGLYTDEEV